MKVLLVVIDAASPRVMCPAVQTGRLPNLKRLADAGQMHQESVTIFPSITPAATTSIITGCYPARHGIAGAAWFDESSEEIAYYGDDFWVVARRGFGAFLNDFLVRLNGDRLTAPTLFELVEQAGRSAGSVNYLVHRGLRQHRVRIPWLLALLPGVPLTESVSGPSLLCLGDFAQSRRLQTKIHRRRGVAHRFGMDDDASAAMLVELAAANLLPDLTVAYFADNDFRSHEVGPFPALPVIERVDAALGATFDAAGGLERFLQETCVIVTSDHGHSEILTAEQGGAVALDTVLGDFRQATLGKPWRQTDDILICPNMRAAQIYLRAPSLDVIERIARSCLLDPRVDLTLWRTRDDAGSFRYHAAGPAGHLEFWRASEDGEALSDPFGGRWRCRGDFEVLQLTVDGRDVDSTEYPNALERLAGALDAHNSAELWVTARPGCEFAVPGQQPHLGGGSHGALHALDSLSPLIAAGAPRRLPRAIRSVDVAPLAMEALGLRMDCRVGQSRINDSPGPTAASLSRPSRRSSAPS